MTWSRSAALILGSLAITSNARGEIQNEHRAAAAHAATLGEELARDKRFAEAAPQFATAYGILETRGLANLDDARLAGGYLYGWAQAERLAGNCPCAIALYDAFLQLARERFPASRNWPDKAEAGIAACPALPPDRGSCTGTVVEVSPAIAPVPEAPARPPIIAPRSPWYRDPLGDTLALGGVLAIVGGAWMVHSGFARADEARANGISYDAYVALEDSARWRTGLGWPTIGVGVLAIGGAIIRYATRPTATATIATVPAGGVVIGVTARF